MVKYSEVYECEIDKDRHFKKSKIMICLLCLLTIAILMSVVSQNFYWAFALFIGVPIYFLGMNFLFRYQANSLNINQNGCICMVCSILWIFGLIGLFLYLYLTSYAEYFSQKYTQTSCRAYSIEKVQTSTQTYYSITYEIIRDTDAYLKERGITNGNTKQSVTPPPLANQIYGCGCTSNKQREMSADGLSGYSYTFQGNGSLRTLPFWLCDAVTSNYVPTLLDYSSISTCYYHSYGSPSLKTQQDQNVCSNSGAFLQITFDSPPYYNYQQFLYMIGFVFMALFGVACNFPMTYLVLYFAFGSTPQVKERKYPADRRKVFLCAALKKALVMDRIKKQSGIITGETNYISTLSQMNSTTNKAKKDISSHLVLNNCIKDIVIPDNQSITYFRKEILEELIEFLYTDNVHYHIVKRRFMSMQRNRMSSHYTGNNSNNQSQINQNSMNNPHHRNHQQNVSQDANSVVININQLLNLQIPSNNANNNIVNNNNNNQSYFNQNQGSPQQQPLQIEQDHSQRVPPIQESQLQQVLIGNPQNRENQGLNQGNQIGDVEIDIRNNNLQSLQNNNNTVERRQLDQQQIINIPQQPDRQIEMQENLQNQQLSVIPPPNLLKPAEDKKDKKNKKKNNVVVQSDSVTLARSEAFMANILSSINRQQIQIQSADSPHFNVNGIGNMPQLNLKANKSKSKISNIEEEEFKSEDYRDDDDIEDEEIQWNNFDTHSEYNDQTNSNNLQFNSGNNLKLRNRQSSILPPLLSNFSNKQVQMNYHHAIPHLEHLNSVGPSASTMLLHTLRDSSTQEQHLLPREGLEKLKENSQNQQSTDAQKENAQENMGNHEQIVTQPCDNSFAKCKFSEQNNNDSPIQFIYKIQEEHDNPDQMDLIKEDQQQKEREQQVPQFLNNNNNNSE